MKYFNASDFTCTPVSAGRPKSFYAPAATGALPVVTVITPFYNTGPVFRETFSCVRNQSLQRWEWIIVNDGSNDATSLHMLDECRASGDPRIRIIDHGVNKGLSAARNTGFRNARCEFVFQLDSDDLIEPTTLEKLAWSLASNPQSSFVSSFTVGFGEQQYLWTSGFHERDLFLRENPVTANCMIRRSVHAAVGGYDERRGQGLEDWDFWLRCAEVGYWGHTVNEFLEWYRRRSEHKDRWRELDDKGISAFRRQVSKRYPKLKSGTFPHIVTGSVSRIDSRDILPFSNPLSNNPNSVLLILPWLVTGGADKFNLALVQQLTARGIAVTIATTGVSQDTWCHEFARYTRDIFMLHRFIPGVAYPRFLRYLIESRQPDIVLISNSEIGYVLLPYLRSQCPAPVYLDYCHMEELDWRDGGFPAISVQNKSLLDGTMTASAFLKNWMIDRGGDGDRIHVCRVHVDADKWQSDVSARRRMRSQWKVHERTVVILYAARLCRQKLPLLFGATMNQLARNKADFLAVVAGDGEDRRSLERYIRRHRLQQSIVMLGFVPLESMPEVMAGADIFFLPSQNEGISMAIYEAMASGLAVVAADAGGQRELIGEGAGILIDPAAAGADKRYTAALERLISNPEERQQIGKLARARVIREFTVDKMADKFEAVCQWTSKNRRPARGGLDTTEAVEKAIKLINMFRQDQTSTLGNRASVRARFYAAIIHGLRPYYYWCLDHNLTWIVTLKNLVRKGLGVDEA